MKLVFLVNCVLLGLTGESCSSLKAMACEGPLVAVQVVHCEAPAGTLHVVLRGKRVLRSVSAQSAQLYVAAPPTLNPIDLLIKSFYPNVNGLSTSYYVNRGYI